MTRKKFLHVLEAWKFSFQSRKTHNFLQFLPLAHQTMVPRPLLKKLGLSATVLAKLNFIQPTKFWKDLYPNDYRQHLFKFIITGLDTGDVGKHRVKLANHPKKTFYASVSAVKLEKSGPPNQLLRNDSPLPAADTAPPVNVNVADDRSAKDREPVENGAIDENNESEEGNADDTTNNNSGTAPNNINNGPTTDGKWSWTEFLKASMQMQEDQPTRMIPVFQRRLRPI